RERRDALRRQRPVVRIRDGPADRRGEPHLGRCRADPGRGDGPDPDGPREPQGPPGDPDIARRLISHSRPTRDRVLHHATYGGPTSRFTAAHIWRFHSWTT